MIVDYEQFKDLFLPVLVQFVWSGLCPYNIIFMKFHRWFYPRKFIMGQLYIPNINRLIKSLCQLIIVHFPRMLQERVLSVLYQDTGIFILCILGAVH